MSNEQNPAVHARTMYEIDPTPARPVSHQLPADPLAVTTEGNMVRVGVDPVSRMSANVVPADEVAPSITWKDHVRGIDKEVVVMDQSDPFDDSLRALAQQRDFAIERANACIGPDGNALPGMERELERWTGRLAGIQHSIDYQVHVAARERQKQHEAEVGFVNELQEDAAALNDHMAHLRIRETKMRRGY